MPTHRRQRGLVAALVALALAPLVGCDAVEPAQAPTDAGPLRTPDPHAWGHPVEVGSPFADGLEVLRLEGSSSATIETVELVGAPQIQLLGAVLLPPGRELGSIQVLYRWSPRDRDIQESDLIPAEGATIDGNKAGWELFLGLRVEEVGQADRAGVKVEYTVDGERFATVLPAFLRVCAMPAGAVLPRQCNPPENWLDAVS